MFCEQVANLVAEVPFYFEHETGDALINILSSISQHLISKRIHASSRLATPNRTEDGNAGEQAAIRDDEPTRVFRRFWALGMMELPHHEIQFVSRAGVRILGQRLRSGFRFGTHPENVGD